MDPVDWHAAAWARWTIESAVTTPLATPVRAPGARSARLIPRLTAMRRIEAPPWDKLTISWIKVEIHGLAIS